MEITTGQFFATNHYGRVCRVTKVTPSGVSYERVDPDGTAIPSRRNARNWKPFDEVKFVGNSYDEVQAQKKADEMRQQVRRQAEKDVRTLFAVEVAESGLAELLQEVADKILAKLDADYAEMLDAITAQTGVDLSGWKGLYIADLKGTVRPNA